MVPQIHRSCWLVGVMMSCWDDSMLASGIVRTVFGHLIVCWSGVGYRLFGDRFSATNWSSVLMGMRMRLPMRIVLISPRLTIS